jgi:Tol biopolymer transport system component
MRKLFTASVTLVALATMLLTARSAVIAQVQSNAEAALKAAMDKEVVQGDLKGAIEQYKKIAESKDRSLAAKALIRMAECYQKLGDAESRKIYEQVVKDYADQKEAVAFARARLGAPTQNAGIITRQVWTGPKVDAYGTVSPDGRFLSFTDWDTGDLALHDFATGQDRHLTNKGTWEQSDEQAILSTISRDGKQVAYEWHDGRSLFEVRLIDLNGGKPRVLVPNRPGMEIMPLDWSPDGRWIAVLVFRNPSPDVQGQIGLVSTADGTLRLLKSVDRPLFKLTFSPDGKYLAYDLEANRKWEIRVLAVDGISETTALAQPDNDRVLGWSPDGKLLFASDRSGLSGIWSIAITDGKPQGAPELIKANVNPNSLGLSRSGALYYSVVTSGRDVYVASVDFETGKVLSAPNPVPQPYLGLNDFPQWSRDGKYLAYLSRREASERSRRLTILAIRSVETGKVRELNPKMRMLNRGNFPQPLWSPDGGSLVVNGADLQGRAGVYRIDTQNGEAVPVVLDDPGRENVSTRAWSLDGRTLYLARVDVKSRVAMLFARDMQSGQEREILRRQYPREYPVAIGGVAPSPDGRLLAVTVFDGSTQSGSLLVIPAGDGEARELLHTSNSGPEQLGVFVAWTPDGKYVIFRKGGPPATRETFRIPAEGGAATKYGAEWTPGPFSINPDGRQVAFPMGEHKIEIWALENFLPKPVAGR